MSWNLVLEGGALVVVVAISIGFAFKAYAIAKAQHEATAKAATELAKEKAREWERLSSWTCVYQSSWHTRVQEGETAIAFANGLRIALGVKRHGEIELVRQTRDYVDQRLQVIYKPSSGAQPKTLADVSLLGNWGQELEAAMAKARPMIALMEAR